MKTIFALMLLGWAASVAADTVVVDKPFTVRLGLTNGHIQEVFFGCAVHGTDGFDRGLDDLAPPPGLGTGYTALVPPVGNLPPFYKDIRGLAGEVTWRLRVRVHTGKPVEVSWDAATLPEDRQFAVRHGDQVQDMREVERLVMARDATVTITAKRRVAEEEAPNKDAEGGAAPALEAAE